MSTKQTISQLRLALATPPDNRPLHNPDAWEPCHKEVSVLGKTD